MGTVNVWRQDNQPAPTAEVLPLQMNEGMLVDMFVIRVLPVVRFLRARAN